MFSQQEYLRFLHKVCWLIQAAVVQFALVQPALLQPSWAQKVSEQNEAAPTAASSDNDTRFPTLEELKAAGVVNSSYRKNQSAFTTAAPRSDLESFSKDIRPILEKACVRCHGAETQEGNIRIDTLNPDLSHGADVSWWLEIVAVLSNGEMPPPAEEPLRDEDRSQLVEWLSKELQVASMVRRAEQGRSSFRRMTRYEYNYALQDLLGLPYDFARDLPPESISEDGFLNSSELLHMSASQFGTYRELSHSALKKATVRGTQPAPIYWAIPMPTAAKSAWAKQDEELEKLRQKFSDNPEKQKQALEKRTAEFQSRQHGTHYKDLARGRVAGVSWDYGEAKYAWKPTSEPVETPAALEQVVIIPPRQHLIIELGDTIPNAGTLRVRFRAARTKLDAEPTRDTPNSTQASPQPSLQLEFGWQASNDSQASVRISQRDISIDALPGQPKFYEWNIPLCEVQPRNSVRGAWKMGDLPSPSEYVKLVNSSVLEGDVQIDFVEITAPVYEQWPPVWHNRIFFTSANRENEAVYANEVLTKFMSRAWRRPVTAEEIEQKLALFNKVRPACSDFEEAMIEVLATVLSSPKFLYLVQAAPEQTTAPEQMGLSQTELATRLSMFLWCSLPDEALLELAARGELAKPDILTGQVERMLADARSRRFAEHFVRQWLGMQLLDYLHVDRKAYPQFDATLQEAMREEPVAFFQEVLMTNASVLDFLHADYTLVNERLAEHYGIKAVHGNEFRRVTLEPQHKRGGLLTQAGLLAMNSDGKDSHPLKRGIWMLKGLLDDPPPPPPAAVPKIDLTDPEIAKLTLKQRIENHRNQAACISCHSKIDPWGIAFENFDAVGNWRMQIQGIPVDASSQLFNGQKIDGVEGVKRFLLEYRQDQFVRALVHKMTTYALGRPLTFGDRAAVDQITAEVRTHGDGLATIAKKIVSSPLFLAN
jgi:cytochrome c553